MFENSMSYSGLEIDNEKVKNNSIFDTSKKGCEFLHSITKIKSREYRSIETSNRYFSLTQLTATASTYVNANGGGGLCFKLGKVKNVVLKA